jgi:hypothetical protein
MKSLISLSVCVVLQPALASAQLISIGVEIASCDVHALWVASNLLELQAPFSTARELMDSHRKSPNASIADIEIAATALNLRAEAVWLRPERANELGTVAIVRVPAKGNIGAFGGAVHFVVVKPLEHRWVVYDFPKAKIRIVEPVNWLYEIAEGQGQRIIEVPMVPALLLEKLRDGRTQSGNGR